MPLMEGGEHHCGFSAKKSTPRNAFDAPRLKEHPRIAIENIVGHEERGWSWLDILYLLLYCTWIDVR